MCSRFPKRRSRSSRRSRSQFPGERSARGGDDARRDPVAEAADGHGDAHGRRAAGAGAPERLSLRAVPCELVDVAAGQGACAMILESIPPDQPVALLIEERRAADRAVPTGHVPRGQPELRPARGRQTQQPPVPGLVRPEASDPQRRHHRCASPVLGVDIETVAESCRYHKTPVEFTPHAAGSPGRSRLNPPQWQMSS